MYSFIYNLKSGKFYILHFAFYIIITSLVLSCSSPTETPKGSLTGTINLEGPSDHSGITIALYNLAYLDTTIIRINNQYPQIGVHINQHTEFDHRLQSPIKTTETHADGSFEIKKIPTGVYNCVAIKDGWGFKYLYEIEITEGDNYLSNVVPLYEAVHISGDISDDIVVATDHHLIIDDDTDFIPNTSSLTIQPGAVIRINPRVDLTIHGNFSAQGEENNMFWITSNDGFEENVRCKIENGKSNNSSTNFKSSILNLQLDRNDDIALYNSMELSDLAQVENDLIDWGKWDYANTGLLNKVNNLTLQNGIFRDGSCGFMSTSVDSTHTSNILANRIDSEENAGIFHYLVNSGTIVNNVILNCANGIMAKDYSNPKIYNNYCIFNEFAFQLYISESSVYNNTIMNCENGMRICGPASPNIYDNYIDAEIGFLIGYSGYYSSATPEIHNNNIQSEVYFYKVLTTSENDINSQENYYFTTDMEYINSKILDKYDYPPETQYRVGLVFIEPILTEFVYNSGVQ